MTGWTSGAVWSWLWFVLHSILFLVVWCVSHLYPQHFFFNGRKWQQKFQASHLHISHISYGNDIWPIRPTQVSCLLINQLAHWDGWGIFFVGCGQIGAAHTAGWIGEGRNGIRRSKCLILHAKQSLFQNRKITQGKGKNAWGSGFATEAYLSLPLKLSSTFP